MKSGLGLPRSAKRLAVVAVSHLLLNKEVVAEGVFDGSSYARNVSLDANVDIFWTIDVELETIRVAVHAKAASGWAGFGVSEMGGMEGADIVFYEVSTGSITDAHAIVAGMPVCDECMQDWSLLSAGVGTDGLVFEAQRSIDTGDSQDRVFIDDSEDGVSPTRLIAAWGDSETIEYHVSNFAKGEAIMFGGVENSNADPLLEVITDPAVSFFDVAAKDFTIPATRTWYELTCVSASELPALEEFHAIGFEGLVQSDTSKYIHHVRVRAYRSVDDCGQACDAFGNNDGDDDGDDTTYSSSSSASSACNYNFADIFLWTPGSTNSDLPHDVGFRFGGTAVDVGGFRSVSIQTHYNNPDEDAGVIDSSGVRVYYTEELREMDMGVLELGDPFVGLIGMPLPAGKSSFSFSCPGSCTEENFELDSVTVHSHFLHMHENGRRLHTRQYRTDSNGNEFVVHVADIEYYSFPQAGGHVTLANDSVTIQKGDRFETDCYYDTGLSSVGLDNVTFGLGSQNEMCIDFLFYYPTQNIPQSGVCGFATCGGELVDASELDAASDFNRTFGIIADACTAQAVEDEDDPVEQSTSASGVAVSGVKPLAFAAIVVIAFACVHRAFP